MANTINLPVEKYNELCKIRSQITDLREKLKTKPSGAKDLANDPENCAKIYLLIDQIHKNITTNKSFIKRQLGSIYDYFDGWDYLRTLESSNFYIELKKLTESTKSMPASTNSIYPINFISENEINQICNKYLLSPEKEKITTLLISFLTKMKNKYAFSDKDFDDLLITIGSILPKYFINRLLKPYMSQYEVYLKFKELNISPFWSRSSIGTHKKSTVKDFKIKLLQTAFPLKGELESLKISGKSSHQLISELKEKSPLSDRDKCIYLYNLYGAIPVVELMTLLDLNYSLFYEVKNALGIPNIINRPKNKTYTSKNPTNSPALLTPISSTFHTFMPNGDIQIIIKYGTPEHVKYLASLNEQTTKILKSS